MDRSYRPGLDALLLIVLLIARVRIDSLAEMAVLPNRVPDVLRNPWLGNLLPSQAEQAFGPWFGDPIALLLIALALGGLILYLLTDTLKAWLNPALAYRLKLALLWFILLTAVIAPTLKLILLRLDNGPASYCHDGGVIQTEATVRYLLTGKNPYIEDYVNTPMAEWGFNEFRTALYHYPYL
ncbi:MAG TPA: hypothetical protein EYH31_07260, partial [Anaerolineae bacterium]|nr:hypothetical protein [Anaerolineae bacterium]